MTYMIGTGVCDVTSFNVLGCKLVQQVLGNLARFWSDPGSSAGVL
jgi:hypothetical protein